MKKPETKFSIIADYYTEHYDEIIAFVAKRLAYANNTEDIVQNVFLKLLAVDKMITPVTLPSLVYTIAKNLIYDYWRHRKTVDEYEHYLTYYPYSDDNDTSSVYSSMEITELLEGCIARLNDKQRDIYKMNLFDGLQVSEISQSLNINYKSVENRLGLARKEVRNYMAKMLA
jgi:RNA polymerase sigma factor (sigma-70 family)